MQCAGHTISAQKSVKYLGIETDQRVSGEEVAEYVICKANARLKFLYQHAKYLDSNCGKLHCSALIQCLFDYASCSWFSGLNAKFKNKLQTTQNKTVRFITKSGPHSHAGRIERSQIGYLSVDDIESNFFAYNVMPTSILKKEGRCIHILWCIFMGPRQNDPWVESQM